MKTILSILIILLLATSCIPHKYAQRQFKCRTFQDVQQNQRGTDWLLRYRNWDRRPQRNFLCW